ncbi:PaaI family thioesterase [Nocardioides marmotae]|uniref:PaaI family thioesterase n=1 Tax=Nocardioides marmotae TaxID=2663857 RepID=UPI00132C239A|nr:PaaI family thioesterase [Nocardioides marmotae]MBC9733275.1 PaaI family thioesterase [Nocardioides marmotae]MTB84385.1 PaaI family thioesterase [Nocardioides marmotae]
MSAPGQAPSAGYAAVFVHEDVPTAEVDRLEALHRPLADSVRDLVDATIRTTVEDEEVRAVRAEVDALVARLRARQLDGPAGVRYNAEGRTWSWGNAVVGERNAVAPPLEVVRDDGLVHADTVLGAAYEGPPGMVHGGVGALLLDHVMGVAASAHQRVTLTGTLTMRYVRSTPLGPVRVEARIEREEGRKVFVVATLGDPDGVTVEADGVFIVPRWAV